MENNEAKISISPIRLVILSLVFANIAVIFDIPIFRQIVGLFYLMFLPGFVILKAVKLDRESTIENVVLSVGLSIAFLMFMGLLANELFSVFGISRPLSALLLVLTIDSSIILMSAFLHLSEAKVKAAKSYAWRSMLLLILPALAVLGAFVVNVYNNNLILIIMLGAIAGIVLLGSLWKKILPSKIYPVALLAITLGLMFHQFLITDHIIGYDVHGEYHVFKLTREAENWDSMLHSFDSRITKGNAMLSVTILPSIFSIILNINETWTFKLLYPLVVSILAVALFALYRTQTEQKYAFLSAFLFVSQSFLLNLSSMKMIVALLFLVLVLFVVLKQKVWNLRKGFLFMVFGAGLLVSHYSTSYVLAIQLVLIWLSYKLPEILTRKSRKAELITTNALLFLISLIFAWYIFTSWSAPFNAIMDFGSHVTSNLITDFFSPSARSTPVLQGLGLTPADSLLHQVGRFFFYTVILFIIIGFMKLFFRRKGTSYSPEYALFSLFNIIILGMCIVVPNFASTFRMERFFILSLTLLAPLFTLGIKETSGLIFGKRRLMIAPTLMVIVLIPFFLFQTGFIYEVTGDTSYSIPLSMYRIDRVKLYNVLVDEREVSGAEWLRANVNLSDSQISADYISIYHVLTSYGMFTTSNLMILRNVTDSENFDSYTYLRFVNIEDNVVALAQTSWNASDISNELFDMSLIYANGGCQIYASRPTD